MSFLKRCDHKFLFSLLTFSALVSGGPVYGSGRGIPADSVLGHMRSSLINYGFENVRLIAIDAVHIQVEYENRILRNELAAAGVVMHLIADVFSDSLDFVLTPLNRGVAITAIQVNGASYRRFMDGNISDHDFVQSLRIGGPSSGALSHEPRRAVSFRKMDFTIAPGQTIQLGNYEDPFKYSGYLVPEIVSFLWPGAVLRAQAIVPVYDEINQFTKEIRLSRLAINQALRLPAGGLLGVSLGVFEPSRYGISTEAGYFLLHQHFWAGAGLDYTGFLLYQNKEWTYSEPGVWTDKAFIYYFFNKLDFVLGLQYAEYLLGDHGWSLHLSRMVGDVKFGFYAARTDRDKFGGFNLTVPLSPMRQPSAKRVRLNWPSQYTWSYRATSETITIDTPLATGQSVLNGFELIDFQKKMTASYIRNNIGLWKKSKKYIN